MDLPSQLTWTVLPGLALPLMDTLVARMDPPRTLVPGFPTAGVTVPEIAAWAYGMTLTSMITIANIDSTLLLDIIFSFPLFFYSYAFRGQRILGLTTTSELWAVLTKLGG